jgi:Domain of unknown function (DUF4340)
MTPKQLKQIAAGLLVLVVLWGGLKLFKKDSDTTTAKFALPALTANDVDTVSIYRSTDTLVIAKRGPDAWSVNGRDASLAAVNDLFQALKGVTTAELVAQSAASHKDLGVDSASGKRLAIIKGGKTLVDVIVGGHGPAFEGVYVRRPAENAVYLIQGGLGNAVDKGLDDWRDRTIAKVDPDSVQTIDVRMRPGGYVLRRGAKGWQFASGGRADSGAVRRMLEQYRNLQAGGFPTKVQEDSISFAHPTRRVTLQGASHPLADLVMDSTTSWWWVRGADGGTIFRLETWRLPQLFPADSTLKAKPAPKTAAKPAAKAPATKPAVKQP